MFFIHNYINEKNLLHKSCVLFSKILKYFFSNLFTLGSLKNQIWQAYDVKPIFEKNSYYVLTYVNHSGPGITYTFTSIQNIF